MNLVYFIIHKYYPNLIRDEDMVQCGMLGLCKAAETWDESKSKFSTYASCCIGYEITKELKRRKRQINAVSLDCPVKGKDGTVDSLGDFIEGASDVDYVDVQPFYDILNPREHEVFSLLHSGFTTKEVAKQLGVSNQLVWFYIRRLKTLWRKHYGE